MSKVSAALRAAKARRGNMGPDTESARVCLLPREAEDKISDAFDLTPLLQRPGAEFRLHPVQSAALGELATYGGLLGPIGVGHGKALIALLAGVVVDAKVQVILAPAATIQQLRREQRRFYEHFKMLSRIYIYSYDQLSLAKNTNLLDRLCANHPDKDCIIIADEAHKLKRLESARTKRLIRFFQRRPAVHFVALSGTLTAKSLRDFGHLAELALRENSPLPRDGAHLDAWAESIDVDGRPNEHHWRMIQPLWDFYRAEHSELRPIQFYHGERKQEMIRTAFQTRLWSSPGVVATGKGSLGCSLLIHTSKDPEPPEDVKNALLALKTDEETPDGEILEDDIAMWRAARCISQGFWYRWAWERTPSKVEDTEWLMARRAWFRCVRAELVDNSDEGYDSPFLVFCQIQREVRDGERDFIHHAWIRWDKQRHKKPPPTVPVWISDFFVRWAKRWSESQGEPVILWYDTKAVEAALVEAGLPVYGAGTEVPMEAKTCGMSIHAHGTGKNLQAWRKQIVLAPPTSGEAWEQLLGRTHRFGQDADEVEVHVCTHTKQFEDAFEGALKNARYIEHTSGNKQKLLFATVVGR